MLKPDELLAKQILEQFFHSNSMNIEIIEGDDPPDLVAIYGKKHIPLEVTRAEDKCFGKNGLENRRTFDTSLINLCNEINEEFGKNIPSNKTLYLYIVGPALDGSKFKKSFRKLIQSIVTNETQLNTLYHTPLRTIIEGVPVELKLIHRSSERRRIAGAISNRNSIINILSEVSLVLSERLHEKERKIQDIGGEKWLAIHNNLVLATSDNFVQVYSDISTVHSFTRIFLLCDGEVTELYTEYSDQT